MFSVGGQDASFLSKEFAPIFTADDILSLETRDMYVKMSIKGRVARPFSARTITTSPQEHSYLPDIISYTHMQYATNRVAVERNIEKWTNAKSTLHQEHADNSEFPEPIL